MAVLNEFYSGRNHGAFVVGYFLKSDPMQPKYLDKEPPQNMLQVYAKIAIPPNASLCCHRR